MQQGGEGCGWAVGSLLTQPNAADRHLSDLRRRCPLGVDERKLVACGREVTLRVRTVTKTALREGFPHRIPINDTCSSYRAGIECDRQRTEQATVE